MKRPSLDPEFGQVPFPCGCLGSIWWYSWHRTSESVEGRGKTSGLWRIRSTWTTCWYREHTFLQARENFSLFKIMCVYCCCSVWKRKAGKNWCRKKEQLCKWIHAGVARGYPRKPGTPGSSTVQGAVWSTSMIFQSPLWGTDFWSWCWCVCFLLGLGTWKKVPVCWWLMSVCICPSDYIYPFLSLEQIVYLFIFLYYSHHLD